MAIFRILLFLFWVMCFSTQAQHSSQLGRFTVPYARACAPVTVSVTSTDSFGDVARTYFYEEGMVETTDTFYTYTEPGIYKIIQFPAIDVTPKTDTLLFEVVAPTPPLINLFQCSSTEVQVEVPDTVYDRFLIKFTEEDSILYAPGDPAPSYDYGANAGSIEVTGYYNDSYPNCGSSYQSFNLSNPTEAQIVSADILQGCEDQFLISINLQREDLTRYRIVFHQSNDRSQVVHEGALTSNEIVFPVTFNPSDPTYCVQVETLNACTDVVLGTSNYCSSIDLASLSPLTGSYASYDGNAVRLHINDALGNEVRVFRKSDNSSEYQFIQSITGSYRDQVPSQLRHYLYKLIRQDTCGNILDSTLLAAPFIKLLDKNKLENTISITSVNPVNGLGQYEQSLLIYNPDSTSVVTLPYDDQVNLPVQVGPTQHIRIVDHYTASGISLFSNRITTSYETTIFVPRAFTPNGDRFNDQLELFGLPTNEFKISIFSRWGDVIHQAVDNPVWDGRINGEPAPEGTYRYQLEFVLSNGEVRSQVGTFVLLKR